MRGTENKGYGFRIFKIIQGLQVMNPANKKKGQPLYLKGGKYLPRKIN